MLTFSPPLNKFHIDLNLTLNIMKKGPKFSQFRTNPLQYLVESYNDLWAYIT